MKNEQQANEKKETGEQAAYEKNNSLRHTKWNFSGVDEIDQTLRKKRQHTKEQKVTSDFDYPSQESKKPCLSHDEGSFIYCECSCMSSI